MVHMMSIFQLALLLVAFSRCSADVNDAELTSLYELYQTTRGWWWHWHEPSRNGAIWNFSDPAPCANDWQGVRCVCSASLCSIIALNLTAHNLSGSLPASLANLTSLQILDLSVNQLTGAIPSTIGNLSYLHTLLFHFNILRGALPLSFAALSNLTWMDVQHNQLEGSVPSSFAALQSLKVLRIASNQFAGNLSQNILQWEALEVLDFADNRFTGSIPDLVDRLPRLEKIDLSINALTSTIPVSFALCENLTDLILSDNELTGTIPAALFMLPMLRVLRLSKNRLFGTLQNVSFIDNLLELDLAANALSGSLPQTLANISHLTFLQLHRNSFTGQVPSALSTLQHLSVIELYDNSFSGDLQFLTNLRLLSILDVSNNGFQGGLPLAEWKICRTFYVNNNYLTGEIPSQLVEAALLEFIDIGNNLLSGPLPNDFVALRTLVYLAMNDNLFTGPVPSKFGEMVHLAELSVQNNRLNGSLPDVDLMRSLVVINVAHNSFTGRLPVALSRLPQLRDILLADNAFTGTLDFLVDATRQRFINTIDVSENQLTGTLPSEIFRIPSLNSFAATANCFHGPLPTALCSANNLSALALNGLSSASSCSNRILPPVFSAYQTLSSCTGTIPSCVFQLPKLTSLHLSGNAFEGRIPSNAGDLPTLQQLDLSHNYLTGEIPRSLQHRTFQVLDLSYNKLTGGLSSKFPAYADSDSLVLQVNRLSGDIPGVFRSAVNINILTGNIFLCGLDRSSLPLHDPGYNSYQCGSAAAYASVLLWPVMIALLCVAAVCTLSLAEETFHVQRTLRMVYDSIQCALAAWDATGVGVSDDVRKEITLLREFLQGVRYLSSGLCLFIVGVLMPVYAILSFFYRVYDEEYGWIVSAVFLHGSSSGAILASCFMAAIALFVYLFHTRLCPHYHQLTDLNHEREASVAHQQDDKPQRRHGHLLISGSINAIVMLAVNMAYVYVAMNNGFVWTILIQLGTAIFKVVWNEFVQWRMVAYWRQYLFGEKSTPTSVSSSPRLDMLETRYMIICQLLNNIIFPCLAVAAISKRCLYSAIISESSTQVEYTVEQCALIYSSAVLDHDVCLFEYPVTNTVSYIPPFSYTYLCSEKLVTTYVPVHICVFLIVGIILPTMRVFGKIFHKQLPDHSELRSTVGALLPPRCQTVTSLGQRATYTIETFPLFQQDRVVVRLMNDLAVLMTFGVLYPPLAFFCWVSINVFLFQEQYLIGSALEDARFAGVASAFYERLGRENKGVMHLIHISFRPLMPVSAIVLSLVIFDAIGDTNGWKMALVGALIVFCWPFIMLGIYVVFERIQLLPVPASTITSSAQPMPDISSVSSVSEVVNVLTAREEMHSIEVSSSVAWSSSHRLAQVSSADEEKGTEIIENL